MRFRTALPLALLFASTAFSEQPQFRVDSAWAVLRVIAGDIGPRPMGSPAEQRAFAFAVAKFKAAGCDTAYIMPMRNAQGINTNSGIAIGVSRGTTGRIIIIGGHMDSAGPEIPGANDDGSGAAVVIECARVLARQPHHSTLLFCCWGGEEDGLRGSNYFVDHFPSIDSVDLMLQADMADGAGPLEAYIDGAHQVSSPRWLTQAAFEVFYDDLHYQGLTYYTNSSSINSSGEGASGSDHFGFLMKGIPAIGFVSDVTFPIHTPQDNLSLFTPSGLKRTGDLIIRLAARYDAGIPVRITESYYLLQWGSTLLFVDHAELWILIGLSLGLAAVAILIARRRRLRREPKIRWSGLKLFLLVLLIQSFLWSSENVVGFLSGVRYPWVNRFGWFVALGLISGVVGVWLSTNLARKMHLSREAYGFQIKALVTLALFTLALMPLNPELVLYPAWGLFWVALAVLLKNSRLSLLCVLLAPVLMMRGIFLEELGLLQRELAHASPDGVAWRIMYNAAYPLIFSLLSLPFASAFAGVFRESGVNYFFLRDRRFPLAGIGAAVIAVCLIVMLSFGDTYDDRWRKSVRAEERWSYGADSSSLSITSAESLTGLHIRAAGLDTILMGGANAFTREGRFASASPLVTVSRQDANVLVDTTRELRHLVKLVSARRPLHVILTYRSSEPLDLVTPWGTGSRSSFSPDTPRRKTIAWYSFPDSILDVPVTLRLSPGQTVMESLEVVFVGIEGCAIGERQATNVMMRTTVTRGDTLAWSQGTASFDNPVRSFYIVARSFDVDPLVQPVRVPPSSGDSPNAD